MTRLRMPNLEKYLELSDEEKEEVDWELITTVDTKGAREQTAIPFKEYYKWALEQRDKQQLSEMGKI